ncbi:MAG TPA: L,D-transpeptidase family protein [Acidimicrobiia bacterium]
MRWRRGIALIASAAAIGAAIVVPVTTAAVGAATVAPAATASATTSDGVVYAYGVAQFGGSPGTAPAGPLVGITGKRDGSGYWVLRADGGVYHYGSAIWYGAPDTRPGGIPSPATAIAATADGHGYWVVNSAGNVYAYGDAHYYGQGGSGGIIGIAPTPTGHGYWLAAANGGIYTFGDAGFHGSAFGHPSHGGITGVASTPSGRGYWLVAADGTVYGFGDAAVPGSAWGVAQHPIVGLAPTVTGAGYWLVDADGGLYRYGDAGAPPGPQLTDPRVNAPGHTIPRPGSLDAATVVHSPSIAIDRHVTGIASAAGLHSIWVLSDQDPANAILLSLGARGSAVTAVQQMLVAHGFWVPVTGVFDNDTQQAMWAFQKYFGFSRTGYLTAANYRSLKTAPHVQARSTSGSLVEVDKTREVLFLVQNGVTVWAFNTSTGGGYPFNDGGTTQLAITPDGVFHIIRQVDGLDVGPLGALWRPKYFTPDGIAVHGDSSVPPYPASHGCARISNDAIDYMWATNSLPIGLEVWVYG